MALEGQRARAQGGSPASPASVGQALARSLAPRAGEIHVRSGSEASPRAKSVNWSMIAFMSSMSRPSRCVSGPPQHLGFRRRRDRCAQVVRMPAWNVARSRSCAKVVLHLVQRCATAHLRKPFSGWARDRCVIASAASLRAAAGEPQADRAAASNASRCPPRPSREHPQHQLHARAGKAINIRTRPRKADEKKRRSPGRM